MAVRAPAAVGLKTIDAVQFAEAARLVSHVLVEIVKSAAFVPEIAILLIVTAEVRPLLKVADCAALLDPTPVLANVSVAGLAATLPLAAVPVPDKATVCGLPVAESLKLSVAVRPPVVVGAKIMFAVQLAATARLVPQVFEKISKSPGLVPVSVMLLMVMAVVLPLVSVIAFCAPFPPTGTETQLRLVGEAVTAAKPVTACSAQSATDVLSIIAFTAQLFAFPGLTKPRMRMPVRSVDIWFEPEDTTPLSAEKKRMAPPKNLALGAMSLKAHANRTAETTLQIKPR